MSKKDKQSKSRHIGRRILCGLLAFVLAVVAADAIGCMWHSSPSHIKSYPTSNPYINNSGKPYISAHRSGGGIQPEESMYAFRNCVENDDFSVDVFEFDLHITKDDVLVLLHDDTLDRTTDCDTVLGTQGARPEDYTYDELRQLNIGARFVDTYGRTPYADLTGDDVPDELRILRIEDILDYLMSKGDYDYIIEIKNGGDLGKKGVDILYRVLCDRDLLDDVIFGTFKEEVSLYVDDNYPDLKRSATIKEVLSFYTAALMGKKNFDVKYIALQVPYHMPLRIVGNLATARMINYAHSHDIAVQYWTINDQKQLEYLSSIGADCIMSDYPDELYAVVHAQD